MPTELDLEGPTAPRQRETSVPSRLGPFLILEEVGRGGMGTVYRARHETTGETAAIKVLPGELAHSPGFRDRFRREVMALATLGHPNIVALLDVGEAERTPWYAMEFIPGRSLAAEVVARRRLPWDEVIDIGVQVCHALKHAHDRGVVHRDLKLSNLIRTPDGQVKLTDFGIAKVFDDPKQTAPGGVIGTAEFMSPEQAEGKAAGRRSDLYSLGVLLYALAAGRLPFRGHSALDLMRQHRYGQFDRPGAYAPGLPSELDALIVELMAKDPAKRPGDAHVAARRLDGVRRRLSYRLDPEATGMSVPTGSTPPVELTTGEVEIPSPPPRPTIAATSDRVAPLTPFTGLRANPNVSGRSGLATGRERTGLLLSLLAILAALGSTLAWTLWPRDDAGLAARGDRLLRSHTSEDDREARDRVYTPLLERHRTGEWADLARARLAELAERARARSARTGMRQGLRPSASVTDLSEPERLYMRAEADLRAGDLADARGRFHSLAVAFRGEPSAASWVSAAEDRVAEIDRRPPASTSASGRREILNRANRLDANREGDQARAVREAFVTLYQDDPQAAADVAEVRARLVEAQRP